MQVSIKIKPFLQEFLLCSHGSNKVGYRDIFGCMLAPYLEYIPADTATLPQATDDTFTLELAQDLGGKELRNGTVYISEENQKNFERTLNLYFKSQFIHYMTDKVRYYKQIKLAIEQFCIDHHLKMDHISYEMLKKTFYRHQVQKKTNLSTGKVSLTCPVLLN